ncbi:MAG: c-type cytochrome [Candidatus Acidiferrales bacterium]
MAPLQLANAQEVGAAQPKSAWTISTPKARNEPRGYVQYQDYCAVCHGKGVGKPGTLALQEKYKGTKPAQLAERTDLRPQLVRFCVRDGIGAMPFSRKTEISDADLDAIVAYLTRNNNHGGRINTARGPYPGLPSSRARKDCAPRDIPQTRRTSIGHAILMAAHAVKLPKSANRGASTNL